MNMIRLGVALSAFLGAQLALAQDVTITPLGAVDGEFCVGDRALLFEDPTGEHLGKAGSEFAAGAQDRTGRARQSAAWLALSRRF